MSEERLMGEPADSVPPEKLLGEAGFSLADWVAGITPRTETVRIYGSLHLFGQRSELGYDLEAARAAKDADLVEELKAEIDRLTVQMQDDYVDFKLQGRTQSRRKELAEEIQASKIEDPVVLSMMMVADYVTEPEGVSPEVLVGLAEVSPEQADLLVKAMNQLNSSVPNIGGSRPF